jgi:hypothetical protein
MLLHHIVDFCTYNRSRLGTHTPDCVCAHMIGRTTPYLMQHCRIQDYNHSLSLCGEQALAFAPWQILSITHMKHLPTQSSSRYMCHLHHIVTSKVLHGKFIIQYNRENSINTTTHLQLYSMLISLFSADVRFHANFLAFCNIILPSKAEQYDNN